MANLPVLKVLQNTVVRLADIDSMAPVQCSAHAQHIFYMLLHVRLLLYLFHYIQLEWHCIALIVLMCR